MLLSQIMSNLEARLKRAEPGPTTRPCLAWDALSHASKALKATHPSLLVNLPQNPQVSDGLQTVCDIVKDIDLAFWAPPTLTPARRENLRKEALELVRADKARHEEQESKQGRADLLIMTPGNLNDSMMPQQLSREQRQKFKETVRDQLADNKKQDPHVTVIANMEERLPTISCNLRLSAMDAEKGMPEEDLTNVTALWDTGAQITIITEDVLSQDFRNFLKTDPIHDPYVVGDGATISIGCLFEFSNTIIQIDAIARVVPSNKVPNGRSGIIIGAGIIDKVMYRSIPRIFLGKDVPEDRWGLFNVEAYIAYDGEIKTC